jgi:tellurite resistance protein TerC
MSTLPLWIGFNLFVLLMLALDLGVFHRRAHAVSLREATAWSIFWVTLSLAFNFSMLFWYGPPEQRGALALQFLTGYVIEKSLSVDNIFVFAVLFQYFAVKPRYQHRVLFWGILGALVMRGAMIWAGAELISRYHWILYVFGAFLVYTGAKMMFHKAEDVHPEHNPVFRLARKYLPLTRTYEGQSFFVHRDGKWLATPMLLVLLVVETTDLAFALDSIPAIFAITRDPFIVYTSNVFAILGLRALYFLLAGVLPMFRYLSHGLSLVLMFIGVKMLVEKWVEIPTGASLGVVGVILTSAVAASLIATRREARALGLASVPTDPAKARPAEIATLVRELADPDPEIRETAATHLYELGRTLGETAVAPWHLDWELGEIIADEATVGIAVTPGNFERIHERTGRPRLADVPPDQDAREFELHFGKHVRLDILTTREPGGNGAIARFLEKFGEGIQQVEFPATDVERATRLLAERFQQPAIYPAARPGADGTRVNFFLVKAPDDRKVLIELVEQTAQPRSH